MLDKFNLPANDRQQRIHNAVCHDFCFISSILHLISVECFLLILVGIAKAVQKSPWSFGVVRTATCGFSLAVVSPNSVIDVDSVLC